MSFLVDEMIFDYLIEEKLEIEFNQNKAKISSEFDNKINNWLIISKFLH